MQLFKEIAGKDWHEFAQSLVDAEEKITEYNYEKFIGASVLEGVDTDSKSFKELVMALNFVSRTE